MSNFVSAIIVAAGGSTRMGISDSKQFIPLLGKPAIAYTLTAFQSCALIDEIIVVCREQDMERIQEIVLELGVSKVSKLVLGGTCRAESVRCGMNAAAENAQYFDHQARQRRKCDREHARSHTAPCGADAAGV